ncbi:gliding motility-associated C-terminal domain-containing protein [Pontimicrobium sp. IMCC45349]|uniref:HYR-like domain-containing protein n=1 Tax=Pontimicrobium sp. IMCC45349 TaxID=3391574 RepID=UPI0039A2B1AA
MKTAINHNKLSKVILFIAFLSYSLVNAQVLDPFTARYNETLKGDVTIIANNMLSRTATGSYTGNDGNHDFTNNVYVDIDNDNSTFNSSSANFANPEPQLVCLSIKKALLYWAAADREPSENGDNQPNWNYNDVKLMLPGEAAYSTITADDVIFRGRDTHFSNDPYICVKDITSSVVGLSDPYGKYQVANVEAKTGSLTSHPSGTTGTSGGWQIVFIYESPKLPSKNISLFDGYAHVTSSTNNFDIDFSGFQTVPTGNVSANVVIGSLEGDRDLSGDRLQIRNTSNNFVNISSTQRSSSNFFNSKITVDGANFVNRNPASTNTLGFDAAVFPLSNSNNSIIGNNQTSATLRLTSNQETYGLYLVGLSVDVWAPDLNPIHITLDSGNNPANPGDIIGFDFSVLNSGNDNAVNLEITTTLPPQVTYNPTALPAGVTYSYNSNTGELTFYIDDGMVDVGDPSINLNFDLTIQDESYFLEENCDLSFDLQFTATYNGVQNPNQQNTLSSAGLDACNIGNLEPLTINIIEPVATPVINYTQNNILCNGESTGEINVTVSDGVAPYTYSWTGPDSFTANTEDITNLAAGTYNLIVTDSNVCGASTVQTSITITEPNSTTCDIHVFDCPPLLTDTCADTDTGTTVSWTPPSFTYECCTAVTGDDYSFYVEFDLPENSNDCWEYNRVQRIGSNNLRLFQSNGANVDFTTPLQYFDNTNGTPVNMDMIVPSGTFDWILQVLDGTNIIYTQTVTGIASDGLQTITIPNTVPNGAYKLKFIFDDNGTNLGANNHIEVDRIYYNATLLDADCADGINFVVTSTHNPGDFFNIGNTTVTYTATYTPTSGDPVVLTCDFDVTVIGINTTEITSNHIDVSCLGGNDGSFSVSASGGSAPYSFSLNNINFDNTSGTFTGLSAGVYTVYTKDSNGCEDPSPIQITISTIDTEDPVITALTPITIEGCDENDITALTARYPFSLTQSNDIQDTYITTGYTASDDTEISSITYIDVITPNSNCPLVITRTYTIADTCGNTSTATQTITVVDTTAPTISAPADVTVECGDDTSSASNGTATGSDTCGDVTISESDATVDNCGNTQTITRTWTATDDCGNTSTATQTITVVDTTAPAISAPADVTVECGDDTSSASTGVATGSDTCGDVTISESDATVDNCGNTQTITRTWTATDDCGNTSTATQTITVVDTTAPAISAPADVTVECGDDTSSASTGIATGSDTCGDVTISESDATVDNCGNTQTITRTWTATDDCGNTSTATQTITVVDTTAPTISAPADVTVECGDDTSSASTGTATGSDTCGDVTISESDTTVDNCGNTQTITRTWTATDDCGNTSTATQTITVVDTTAPSISAPADVTVECGDDTSSASTGTATGSDTCGDVTISESDATVDNCGNTQTITRTWTATDDCGNTSTATQTITVVDTTAPAISAPADVTVECGDDTSSASTGIATGSDTCGDVTISESDATVDNCGNTQTITRTWTATDDCGNTSTATQTITVVDTTAPAISAPADVTVECGDDTSSASTGIATGSDTCGDVTISESDATVDNCGNTQTITRTWTATDDCGNTSTATQTITVVDTTAPSISAPADVTVECGDDTSSASTGTATGSDTCGDVTISESDATVDNCGNTQTITRTWTATDDCGNTSTATQTITVVDTTAPAISAPADVTVECGDDTSSASTGIATGSDTCGDVTISESDATVDNCGNTQTITRTWTATDDCGNTSTATQTITVVDTTAPAISAPADVTVECGDDTSSASTGIATGSDTCGDVTISESDATVDNCGNTQTITRTWTATDDCGNTSTATQTITVVDTTAPAISAPADVTVECGDDTSSASTGIATGSDTCGDVTISESDATVDNCGNTQTITRTWTATDDCGNTSTATQTITVVDTTAPSISAPADVTVECGDDTSSASTGTATGSDTCGDVTISESDATVDNCGNTQTITRTWTATDDCGNTSTATQTITVVDTTAPAISAPADVTVECGDDTSSASTGTATGSDTCGDVTISESDATVDNCGNTQTITRTWTATDDCGNTSTATQTITVVDTTAPAISAPADVTVECGDDTSSASTGTATGSDTCGDVTISESDATVDNCGNTQTITRTWTATDDCGNTSTATQTITVVDTTAPAISAPADVTVECGDDTSSASTGVATGSDTCGDVTISESDATVENCGNTQTITRTWTATDDCGNTSTATQTITVVDTTAPAISTPADVTVECGDDTSSASTGVATGSDTCGDVTISESDATVENCGNTQTITRTWTATDDCGNTSTATQTITVVDTTAPAISAPADVTVECGDDTSSASTGIATGSDTCGDVTISESDATVENCGNTQTITRTWTATDDCGNTSTATQTITVVDTTAPTVDVNASNITIECDGNGNNDAIQNWLDTNGGASASDTCGDVTWTNNYNGATSDCSSPVLVTFTATDECGNTTSTSATYSIQDTIDPTIDTQATDLTVECDGNGNINDLNNWLNNNGGAIASDDCSSITWSNDFTVISDDCGQTGSITVIFTATDGCGNNTSTSATFTIQDTTAPNIDNVSVDLTVECDGNGNIDEFNNWLNTLGGANASDECSTITWTNDYIKFIDTCGTTGSATVTFTATDECGNESSTTATFTIQDTISPIFEAPSDVEIFLDENCAYDASTSITGEVMNLSDDCSNNLAATYSDSIQDGICPGTFIITRTWSLSDECGNVANDQIQIITVSDNIAPTGTAPDGLLNADVCFGDAQTIFPFDPNKVAGNYSDNCGSNITVNLTNTLFSGNNCGWTLEYVFNVVDECGNKLNDQSIQYSGSDQSAPTFTVPNDISIECDQDVTDLNITGDVTDEADNCDLEVQVTYTDATTDGACAGEYTLTRTWTATDDCGNSTTHTQTINVQDTTAPTFNESLPVDATVECDNVPTEDTLTATDNCGDATVTFNEVTTDGACAGEYTLTRTWTATDDCGNSTTHTQTINVQDTTAPTFNESLPVDATVECDNVPTEDTLTATDNCGDATVTFNEVTTDGACAGEYTLTRTWTATDDCGNSTTHTQTINVQDTTAPTFNESLPVDATVECDNVPTEDTLTATDNCGDATVTFNEVTTDGACAGEYTLTRTWTATDDCGNSTTHTQTINVQDTTAPTFNESLPVDATVECDNVPTEDTLTATDNCGDATVTFNEVTTDGACAGEYTLTRTWTATDDCGNSTTHTQTINVQDTTAPTFNESLPVDATVECDNVPTEDTLTATDNCGDATVTFNEVTTDGACAGEYTLTRTWTATDDCGNSTTHTQTINVQDTTAPTFNESLPVDATVECDNVPTEDTLTATDNCGDATVTFNEVTTDGACASEYTLTRTWTATDDCGNSTTHTQTINVQDTTAPTFNESLPVDATVECDNVPTEDTLTATDNCGDATVTFNEVTTDGACAGEYTLTRTWTATDDCGNSTTHTQTINVQDTTAPTLTTEGFESEITVTCGDIPEVPNLEFEDACSSSMTVDFEETSTFDGTDSDYEIFRDWTVTDECGNTEIYTQTIMVIVQDDVTGSFTNLCIGDNFEYDLFELLSGDYSLGGTWTVTTGNATLDGSLFNPYELELGEYSFTYSDTESACPSDTEVFITLNDDCIVLPCGEEDVEISKAVTANGDQWNEYFEVTGIEDCGFVIEVQIFNRWGALIYESTNYQNDWNGYAHKSSVGGSNKVPTGTYYYIVKLKNSGLKPFAGPIYVGTK